MARNDKCSSGEPADLPPLEPRDLPPAELAATLDAMIAVAVVDLLVELVTLAELQREGRRVR